MWPDTRICELFGTTHPIILSPMAGSGGPELASAVSDAGGLGSLPCAGLTLDSIRTHVAAVRQKTSNPLSLNFFCHEFLEYDEALEQAWLNKFLPYCEKLGVIPAIGSASSNVVPFGEEHCQLVESLRPAVISFHFGLPDISLLQRVKAVGCRVICSANTVKEALWLANNGCDAIIAQGTEAGGHRGMFLSKTVAEQAGTMALVPQVADAVDIPVIAAGGIVVLSRLRSGLSTHLCGLSLKCQGAFAAER